MKREGLLSGDDAAIHAAPAPKNEAPKETAPRRLGRHGRASFRASRAPSPTRRAFGRVAVAAGCGIALAVVLLWLAINRIPSVGPWLADTARSLFGPEAVARVEEWSYGFDDRWNRWWRRGEKAQAHWATDPSRMEHPESSTDAIGAGGDSPTSDDTSKAAVPPFSPRDVGPLFPEVAARGDGVWVAVVDPMHPSESPVLFKTLIHPDRERPWAELFVAAIDLRQADLFAAAGTIEPVAETEEGRGYARSGVIPEGQRDRLIAAFNGGFKAEHGHYGMKVDNAVLLPPRPKACTIARYEDGSLRIGTWTAIASDEPQMTWWRQTPACMVEGGKLHPGLAKEGATAWGYAVGGETVVRRSAVGLDRERATLFVAVSNATNARSIALGMEHAGATDVAQLDINWSYPHVVLFRPSKDGSPQGFVLFDGFAYDDNTYVSRRSSRDFFYVARRASGDSPRP